MVKIKRRGYMVERKIRKIFEKYGWYVVRAAGSLGKADLVCLKEGKCILIQVKSTKKDYIYYNEYMEDKFSGFDFYVVVDFSYRKTIITRPKKKITIDDGLPLEKFLSEF